MMTTKTTRRGVLAGLPALAAAMAPVTATTLSGLPAQPVADPIFSAIEAHRAAEAQFNSDDDNTGADEWDAYWSLLETAPTTVAGFVAMFTYLAEADEYGYSKMCVAADYWSGIQPKDAEAEHFNEAEWLAMLADAMCKLGSGVQS